MQRMGKVTIKRCQSCKCVNVARVEEADCFCPGIRALRILHRHGARRPVRNLGLDIVVIRILFSAHLRRLGLH
ncbi:unnamed protein product [Pleuronectes platessa]|uniref:Uncharacterized protein n=1 Tax=Pleuronectes platessa TaxID=8262 RepID=A0A9N7UZ22_PLEPL|nr:unnamed protein product [Pleuronectes platessa]